MCLIDSLKSEPCHLRLHDNWPCAHLSQFVADICLCVVVYACVCVCVGGVSVFQGVGAVSVFKECARMRPEDPSLPLLAAKVCIGQLHWVNAHTHTTHTHTYINLHSVIITCTHV